MKIITFASWKGGTGKTTLSVSAITTLAKIGKKILVIDLDSNLSMTRCFGMVGADLNSVHLLNGDLRNKSFIGAEGKIHIIPSDLRISRMTNISDKTLSVQIGKLDINGYDYIFIDPPGTMNALTRNAIVAADQIIIPSMPSMIDFEATGLVFEELEMMDVEADISVVLNGYDSKRNVSDIVESFKSEYKDFYYQNSISAMKSLKNLTANVSKYKLQGRAKEIIDQFVQEVIL